MSEAPERIWAWPADATGNWANQLTGGFGAAKPAKASVEYVRADRIEELEDTLSLRTNLHGEATYLIHRLEAELAKAVEALKDLADCVDDGCFCSEMQLATAIDTARTTLAELSSVSCANLKGETDE